MTVSVIPNLDKRGASEMVEKLGLLLKKQEIKALLPENICCSYYEPVSDDDLFRKADVIITIGGDGTIIRYAKRAAAYGKPILGINAGRMGYLADVELNDYEKIENLKTGGYTVEERMLLDITVKENGKITDRFEALNDAVISSGFISRIIDISTSIGSDSIRYRADGLIAATPTGSTAYSLSAGGPIIDPVMNAVCITPICSHMLSAKPMIVSANKSILIKAFSKKHSEIYLTVDGRKVSNVKPYTEIYLTKSSKSVKLIRLDNRSFYKTLSAKFSDIRGVNGER